MSDKRFLLYHSQATLGWRVIQRVTRKQGERKVARGVWRRVNDEAGNHIGYQFVGPGESRGDAEIPSQRSSASISVREMKLNAEGASRTVGMSPARRAERVAQKLPPEDLAERVQRKVQVFAHIGSAKHDILRVWPQDQSEPLTAAELQAAGA